MKYRTIVADPPWDHSDGTGYYWGSKHHERPHAPDVQRSSGIPYNYLAVAQIAELPVADLAQSDSHLYLWATNRYLRDAYDIAEAWGFRVSKPLVWAKRPKGFFGQPFTSSAEFILFCRRGSLPHIGKVGRQWWEWPRSGHSAKPEAFLDIVEQVSPGPYLELFARRQRLGWDTWGNEALQHVEVSA